MRAGGIAGGLTAAAKRGKKFACLHPFATYPAAVSAWIWRLSNASRSACRGVSIEDQTNLLPSMRAIKSAAELKLMKLAAAATVAGFNAILKQIKPGISERVIADMLEFEYRKQWG